MQLKMLQWRMADTSIGPDDYASLVKREQRCVARMTNFNHALASLEVRIGGRICCYFAHVIMLYCVCSKNGQCTFSNLKLLLHTIEGKSVMSCWYQLDDA